ncbi:MAG: DNA recombination protein RmuC [Clostridia bacterium]|nr:DNA recombination protein RmuC [Clostridia bacterium]
MTTVIIVLLAINLVLGVVATVAALSSKRTAGGLSEKDAKSIVKAESEYQTREITHAVTAANSTLLSAIKVHTETQGANTDRFMSVVAANVEGQDKRQQTFMQNVETRFETMKDSMEKALSEIRQENATQLEKMRVVVEEKMQATLSERLNQSFGIIGEQLDRVREGLGEMKNLTGEVTDLKKVLGGVKTRGVWGELYLGALIEEMLAKEQYDTNVHIGKKGEVVEYAVKMPGKGDGTVWLPIDAKFPLEDYQRLVEASDRGDRETVEQMGKALEVRIKAEAKDIKEKYIKPPQTTDFAVLYLPIEGLFAEVARRPGLLDDVHKKYRVMVTGPTTLSALLNSLLVGFKTVAIEKRSRDIWKLLSAFRNEFTKFAELLEKTQTYAERTSDGIRDVTQKTLKISKKLSDVELLDAPKEGSDEGDEE